MDFFKLNADHAGIYRTSYTSDCLSKLGEAAKLGLLTVEDHCGMVADAGALATSRYQKTSGVLALLNSFSEEKDYVVWDQISRTIGSVHGTWIFQPEEIKDVLKVFNCNLCSPQ